MEPNRYVLRSLSLSLPRKHRRISGLNVEVDTIEDLETAEDTWLIINIAGTQTISASYHNHRS